MPLISTLVTAYSWFHHRARESVEHISTGGDSLTRVPGNGDVCTGQLPSKAGAAGHPGGRALASTSNPPRPPKRSSRYTSQLWVCCAAGDPPSAPSPAAAAPPDAPRLPGAAANACAYLPPKQSYLASLPHNQA